jgi:predicted translin family RNA/ssDNA-binding protein
MKLAAGLQSLKKEFIRIEKARRELQQMSATAARLSKQAIFSFQRLDLTHGRAQLAEAEPLLIKGRQMVKKDVRLNAEGVWRAALEEFCEASFVEKIVHGVDLFSPQIVTDEPDILIGGMADAVGEIVRLAVRSATEHDAKRVNKLFVLAESLVAFLTSLDLTGNLRAKGDQSRQHLRRLEDLRYEMSRQK